MHMCTHLGAQVSLEYKIEKNTIKTVQRRSFFIAWFSITMFFFLMLRTVVTIYVTCTV